MSVQLKADNAAARQLQQQAQRLVADHVATHPDAVVDGALTPAAQKTLSAALQKLGPAAAGLDVGALFRSTFEAKSTSSLQTSLRGALREAPASSTTQRTSTLSQVVGLRAQSSTSSGASSAGNVGGARLLREVVEDKRAAWVAQVAQKTTPAATLDVDLSAKPAVAMPFQVHTRIGDNDYSVEQLLGRLASMTGGQELLAANVGMENSLVGFVRTDDLPAFQKFYHQATGQLPDRDKAAHRLLVNDGGTTRVLWLVPEHMITKEANVLVDMRDALQFKGAAHVGRSPTDEVLARVDSELKAARSRDRSGAAEEGALKGVLDLALRADLNDPRVQERVNKVVGLMVEDRARFGRMGSLLSTVQDRYQRTFERQNTLKAELAQLPPTSPEARDKKAELLAVQKDLKKLDVVDDTEIASYLRQAKERQMLSTALREAGDAPDAKTGRPAWFETLKGELMPRIVDEHFAHFTRLDGFVSEKALFDKDGTFAPPPEHQAAWQNILDRANDKAAFKSWVGGMMDAIADAMMASDDPLVKEQWKNRTFTPAITEQVLRGRAVEQGWNPKNPSEPVFTIDPSGGVIPVDEFRKPIANQQLIFDPVFTVDYTMGPHGKLAHAIVWLYLGQDEAKASVAKDAADKDAPWTKQMIDFYGWMGAPPETHKGPIDGLNLWGGMFDSPLKYRSVLTPNLITRLAESLLGAY
jgi:hypothetical protein